MGNNKFNFTCLTCESLSVMSFLFFCISISVNEFKDENRALRESLNQKKKIV